MALDDLSPNELAILAALLGLLIADSLDDEGQNVVGNFIEAVGQIILTVSAQAEAIESTKREGTYESLDSRIKNLEDQLKSINEKLP